MERKVLESKFLLKDDHVDNEGNASYQFFFTMDEILTICTSID